jgi:Zn-dependent peptidase ImmA (M78 family)/transcriptional regulator with XRE-family HTH domain
VPDLTLFEMPGDRPRLDAVLAVFDPARLTQARHAATWTKTRLADELGVSPAAVGQYESGVIRPRAEQLQGIALLLGMPAEFFAAGRPRAALDPSRTHFRSLRSMRAYERDQALSYVEQLWELCHALERRVRFPVVDLPAPEPAPGREAAPDLPGCRDTFPDAAKPDAAKPDAGAAAAGVLRQRWDLGDGPVSHVVRTMEAHGILVGLLPFSDSGRVDAFSTSHDGRPIVVLAADRPDVCRHRFTAAHELGHLLLHHDAHPGDIRHEREADAFAAEFLMPAGRLAAALPRRVDFSQLIRLQELWGVSIESLLRRSCELGVITHAAHGRARIKLAGLRSQRIVRSIPVTDFPGEIPQLLARAGEASGVPPDELAAELAVELAWPPDAVRTLLRRPPARLSLALPDD